MVSQNETRFALGREFLMVAAGNIAAFAGTFLALKIVASLLTLEQFAQFGLALAFAGGASRLFFTPLSQAALRFAASFREAGDIKLLLSLLMAYVLRASALVAICAVFLPFYVPNLETALIATSAAVSVLLGINVVAASALAAFRQRRMVAVGQVVTAFGRGLLALPFIAQFGMQAGGALLAYALSLIVSIVLQARKLRQMNVVFAGVLSGDLLRIPDGKSKDVVWPYISTLAVISSLEILVLDFDKLVFSHFLTLGDVAILVGLQQLAKAGPVLAISLVEQFIFPIYFLMGATGQRSPNGQQPLTQVFAAFLATLLVMLVISVGISQVATPLTRQLLSPEFAAGASMLPWLMAGYTFSQCNRLLQLPNLVMQKTRPIVVCSAMQAIVLFASFILLVPDHGLWAAVYALIASSLTATVILAGINVANQLAARSNVHPAAK